MDDEPSETLDSEADNRASRLLQMEWDPLVLKSLTNQLRAFSLLDYDTHSVSYSMHPLVQEWCRATAPDAMTVRDCSAWVFCLCVSWESDSESYAFRRRLLPHILALKLDHTQMVPEIAQDFSLVYCEAGYTEENKVLSVVALQASIDLLGKKHTTTLVCMHNLADAFLKHGKLEEAATLMTEVIELEKRVIGHEHPVVFVSKHILAMTYHDQGRLSESETLILEVIEARKRVLGAEHRQTLGSMKMLASTYRGQGRLSEAEILYVEVIEKIQRVLGREHPHTLGAMHNLGLTYNDQGKLREAETLMEETVALRKQVIGESHIYTQSSVQALEDIRRRIQSELVSTHMS